jgi:glycosyltransferase involved in cell wall biosynthesis
MVTDDVMIDRRILLEAESLISQGHEVILLSGWNQGLPTHGQIGNVKVERIIVAGKTSLEKVVIHANLFIIRGINFFSRIINACHSRIFMALDWLYVHLIKKVTDLFINTMKFFINFIIKFVRLFLIKIPAKLTNSFCSILLLGLSKGARDGYLKARIAYYNPDIIHVHDLPQLKSGWLAKKHLKVPLIYDAHELYPEIDTLTEKQKKRLKKLENKIIKHCDEVITVNEFIAKKMSDIYNINEPTVVYNAVNATANATNGDSSSNLFRQKLFLSPSAKILLYQGWMSKTRGLQNLVTAMSLVDESVHLVLMGYGEIHSELQDIIAEHRLAGRVHILDAVPQNELLSWTCSADVGIIPYQPIDLNNYYCSPNKLFEFIQAKIPILANDLPFLRKIIAGHGFGVVEKLDSVRAFAEAINKIFSDQNALVKYKQNLMNHASQFSWEVEEGKLYKIYDRISNEKQS